MNSASIRQLIRQKLADGRLPHNSIPRVWGGPGNGESCQACEEVISGGECIIEGIRENGRGIQLHVECFYIWDSERAPDWRYDPTARDRGVSPDGVSRDGDGFLTS
jgi:hypothetical protein